MKTARPMMRIRRELIRFNKNQEDSGTSFVNVSNLLIWPFKEWIDPRERPEEEEEEEAAAAA